MSPCDTKMRILDSAEHMFSQNGYNNTSMRSLAASAGVNLASANYHFGSKDKLLEAVIERRILPLNQIRQTLMNSALRQAEQQQTLPLAKDLLNAFFKPTLDFRNSSTGARAFVGLVSRSLSEPDKAVRSCFLKLVKPNFEQLFEALKIALPHLPAEILKARLQLSVGTMSYALSMNVSEELTANEMTVTDINQPLIQQLQIYILAGLEAPL
jgi:AcrR family transcriptional regulator